MSRTDGYKRIEAEMAAARCRIISLLQHNLMSTTELYVLLADISGCEFTQSEQTKQIESAIIIPGNDNTFFAIGSDMNQYDNFGAVGVGLSKMLTCGGCRGYHYCSRECQKEDRKLSHKHTCTKDIIRRAYFKTTDICMKILTVLCIDWSTKAMNRENNYVRQHVKLSGCKEIIHVPVYDKKRFCYIPMPLKILSYVQSIADKDPAAKSSLEEAHATFKTVIV